MLRVEAELHDGQRMQIFNVHQATSGDVQLQQHTWQVLAKSVAECRHQRILLGGDLNASANGTRVGYAESNAEHMAKVDALLHNFVHDTQDDRSFIVLTETKFSFRCIPVWDRYSPHRTRVEKKNTCDNALTMTSPVHW